MSFQYPPNPPQPTEAPQVRIQLPRGTPVITYTLLALTIAVYLLQMIAPMLFDQDVVSMWGMKNNYFITHGQWWRLITPMFLHGSIFHIGFNMYALYVLGPSLERFFGRWPFLLLYLVAGVAGNVFSFIFSPYNSLGASTAIFGLLAGQGVFLYQNRKLLGKGAQRSLSNIVFIAIINFVIGLSPGIDNWGHLGGFFGGALFTWFAGPKMKVTQGFSFLRLQNTRSGTVAMMVALLCLLFFVGLAFVFHGATP
jgi:rhomboid protease GluP